METETTKPKAEAAAADSMNIRVTRRLRANATQVGIIAVFLLVWLFFIIAAPDTFLKPQIYNAFMSTIPFFAIMALPLTMAVIAGEMDLSFTSIMALGMVAFIKVFEATDSVGLAFLSSLLTGTLAGLLNGAIVVWIGIPSLVATIGTQFFWRGAVLVILNGKGGTLVPVKESLIRQIMVGQVAEYLPAQMLWLIAIAIATWILLNRHKFGAHIYLIGDNENSARLMGINAKRTRILVFALVGLASAFAGMMSSMQVSYFWPSLGEGYLLRTLASVFLGGTSVFGGVGTILGTFLGSFIIGAIEAGIVAIGLTGFYTQLIYGFIIIVSVSMHAVMRKRMH